jgi:uncharacterized membrane protein
MTQWYLNPVGSYWLVGLLSLGLLALLVFLAIPAARLSRPRRLVLFGLRAAVLVLLMLALLRPTLVQTITKKRSAELVVLIDRSRSMLIEDSVGGKTRWQALTAALQDAAPALADIGEDVKVKGYAFDSDIEPLEYADGRFKLADKPSGDQSALGAALEDVLRREAGQRLAGVIVLSDGAQRAYAPRDLPPQVPTRRLADLGYPLYALPFGQARGLGQARDVAIKDLLVNQTVFVKNELVIHGTARLDGYANQKIPVRLLFETPSGKMQVVGNQDLQADSDGQSLPIEMSYVPQTPGEFKVTLEATTQPGELVTTNNQLSTFVTVLQGGLNVLYVEGALRVEQKFVRRSLDASPDIKVDYIRLEEHDRATHPIDMRDYFQRGKYDVYIVGDVDSSVFKPEELQALAKTVEEGAGLMMLGGFRTFGPGGYYATPLAGLLPLKMDGLERLQPQDPLGARTDLQIPGPLIMQPAKPLGIRHFVMSLAPPSENMETWRKLPPLEGANKWAGLKPTAQVLAETPDGKPLLAVQEAGGRVMAFAGDSTWHWWMQGHLAEHKRFWRQAILWLAHKDDQNQGNVWIHLAQRRFAPGGRMEFTAGANSPHGEPLLDATFKADIVIPGGARRPVALVRQGDQMSGVFSDTQASGDYTIEVTASGGSLLGTTKARFLVFEQDLELDNAAADPTLLGSLARMTAQAGGQLLAPEELSTLIERLKKTPLDLETKTDEKQSPWDTWPFFIVFVSLLCVEWLLRKRWGLV